MCPNTPQLAKQILPQSFHHLPSFLPEGNASSSTSGDDSHSFVCSCPFTDPALTSKHSGTKYAKQCSKLGEKKYFLDLSKSATSLNCLQIASHYCNWLSNSTLKLQLGLKLCYGSNGFDRALLVMKNLAAESVVCRWKKENMRITALDLI